MNLLELATVFGEMALTVGVMEHEVISEATKIVEQAAKDRIGHYNAASGPVPATAPLAPSTQETRVSLGFTADDPLERTGELRDSISSEVDGKQGSVGSPLESALYAEIGTAKEPPRSFLEGAVYDKEEELSELGIKAVVKWVK